MTSTTDSLDFCFEGPEKKLIVDFHPTSQSLGLMAISRADWQLMLDAVACTIISATETQYCHSYVLSESSLFVYPTKLILKTCGTTTLLKCLPMMEKFATRCNTSIAFVSFSRRNFIFPEKQVFPHVGFTVEMDFLDTMFNGSGLVFGPENEDHWLLYVSDHRLPSTKISDAKDQVLEVMMCDLDEEAMKVFFKGPDFVSAKHTTESTGIADLIPGSISDEFQFDPCGYSVNGLLDDVYYTIHVTPESGFSFVSFETNLKSSNYAPLLKKVLDIFRPGRFVVSIMGDMPQDNSLSDPIPGYVPSNRTCSTVESKSVLVLNYYSTNKLASSVTDFVCAHTQPNIVRCSSPDLLLLTSPVALTQSDEKRVGVEQIVSF